MDRFIVFSHFNTTIKNKILKSNMDRFIGISSMYSNGTEIFLKSNMDRFIVPMII